MTTTPLHALPTRVITWALGRRLVVLERRGATWRMMPRKFAAGPAA